MAAHARRTDDRDLPARCPYGGGRRDRADDGRRLDVAGVRVPWDAPGRYDPGAADHETRGDRGCRFEREPGADGGAAAAEERAERARNRNQGQRLDRAALRALTARERCTLGTLAQMRPQLPALLPRQAPVELPRDRELGLAAGQRALELFAQRAPGPEDQRLDRARRDVEDLGDLGIRPALQLAHDERRALVEGEVPEGAPDVLRARRLVVEERVGDVVLKGHLGGAPGRLAEALAADVVSDRDQPVLRLFGPVPLLDERAVSVQEGRLGDILRVGRVAHDGECVPVHVPDVTLVQAFEGPVCTRPLRQQGRHALVDTSFGGILRAGLKANAAAARSRPPARPFRQRLRAARRRLWRPPDPPSAGPWRRPSARPWWPSLRPAAQPRTTARRRSAPGRANRMTPREPPRTAARTRCAA